MNAKQAGFHPPSSLPYFLAASGSSLLLELVTALAKYSTKNRVRFAWWGAEEQGVLGSKYYVNNLTSEEANDILAYLNFDMVARGYFGVFDGDGSRHSVTAPAGSDAIEQLFADELASKGLVVTPVQFTNGSDYASFWQVLSKPVGGLHTGSEFEQDPCYHAPCDGINNPNITILTINTRVSNYRPFMCIRISLTRPNVGHSACFVRSICKRYGFYPLKEDGFQLIPTLWMRSVA